MFWASRFEDVEDPDLDERERMLVRVESGAVARVELPDQTIRAFDRAPSGRVYAAAFERGAGLWRARGTDDFDWERLDLPIMQDLFVLDDAYVMCWAYTGVGVAQEFWLWDGASARPIPSPPATTVSVHGIAPDWIVAVGFDCMVARWDGQTWRPWTLPKERALGSIHVVSPDEMYATGPCGLVFEGSQDGWTLRAPAGGAVGIAKFGGDVVVSDPNRGLLRLNQSHLETVEIDTKPWTLHAGRDALLITEASSLAETGDLQVIRRIGADALDRALQAMEPSGG